MPRVRPTRHDGGWATPPGHRNVEDLTLPDPEPCTHLLGDWNNEGELVCAACGAPYREDTP
jgi:hypothetical protein